MMKKKYYLKADRGLRLPEHTEKADRGVRLPHQEKDHHAEHEEGIIGTTIVIF